MDYCNAMQCKAFFDVLNRTLDGLLIASQDILYCKCNNNIIIMGGDSLSVSALEWLAPPGGLSSRLTSH